MSADRLHVSAVEIVRAPGFESGGFAVDDLPAGVAVVHGPNAAGKTTLCRAIQELLWPGRVEPNSDLVGRYRLNGTDWRVETRRGNGSHQAHGEPANPPPLPPADERDRYVLSLHELLDDDTRDESFAEAIERETAGGYDVRAAADALGFASEPSSPQLGEVRAAEAALETAREVREQAAQLKSAERRLATLEADLEAARAARDRVTLLEQAIDHAEARDHLAEAEAELAGYPEVLEAVDGDEAETVEALTERIEELERARAEAATKRDRARAALDATGLPEGGLEDGVLTELRARRDRLETLEGTRDARTADLENATSSRENALADVPADIAADDLRSLDPAAWAEIDAFATEAIAVREERARLASLERWYDDHEPPETDLSTLERGRQALEGWLKTPTDSPARSRAPLWIGLAAALLLGVAGIALGATVHPTLFGFGLAGIALGAYGYLASTAGGDASAGQSWRREFDDIGVDPPTEWSQSAVRERLTDLHRTIAEHRFVETLEERRKALAIDADELETRERALDEERDALVARFGVAPDPADVELLALAKGVLRWQAHHDDVVGLQAEVEALRERIDRVRGELAECLEPYGYAAVSDAAEAARHVRDLEERATEHDGAERDREAADATIAETDEAIRRLADERRAVYEALDLEPGSVEKLRARCERAEAYREAVAAVERAAAIVAREREKLEAFPEFEPGLTEQSVPELEAELREAADTAGEYDARSNEIGQIEGRIEEAKTGTELEDAVAEQRRALAALEARLEADAAGMVGHVLAEHLREETIEATRPAVFQHARELLARITAGRYRLDLDEDGTFRATDTVQGKGYALDQLSSATRLQVLLAVRVAFVEHQERGLKLPLLLDETLANTDDRKATVIVETMLELARGGRQICYFTAQGDEVAKWRGALEAAGDVPYEIVDLADVQDRDDGVSVPEAVGEWTAPDVPNPDGDGHAAYGAELGVGPFDPCEGASSAHLWYLVDDPDTLSAVLEHGIETWGQLETLARYVEPTALAGESGWLDAVELHGEALETYVDAWGHGRGEPVDRDALEASGAVTGNFIDDVSALAEAVDGDGERIVAALEDGEIKGFRTAKIEELRAYFEAEGYVEDADPLSPAEIRLRVLNSYVTAGVAPDDAATMADELLERVGGPTA